MVPLRKCKGKIPVVPKIHKSVEGLWNSDNGLRQGMDCFGTYFTHVQTCDDVRVQSATEYIASLHTLHVAQPVMSFVFKVLCNGLLRYTLYTCPNM